MWEYMTGQGYVMGGSGMLIAWGAFIWFIVFTILVVFKLDRIADLLSKR